MNQALPQEHAEAPRTLSQVLFLSTSSTAVRSSEYIPKSTSHSKSTVTLLFNSIHRTAEKVDISI